MSDKIFVRFWLLVVLPFLFVWGLIAMYVWRNHPDKQKVMKYVEWWGKTWKNA